MSEFKEKEFLNFLLNCLTEDDIEYFKKIYDILFKIEKKYTDNIIIYNLCGAHIMCFKIYNFLTKLKVKFEREIVLESFHHELVLDLENNEKMLKIFEFLKNYHS